MMNSTPVQKKSTKLQEIGKEKRKERERERGKKKKEKKLRYCMTITYRLAHTAKVWKVYSIRRKTNSIYFLKFY
jgi:hypothetical protein